MQVSILCYAGSIRQANSILHTVCIVSFIPRIHFGGTHPADAIS